LFWRLAFRLINVFLVVFGLGYLLPVFSVLPVSTAALAGLIIASLSCLVETLVLKKEILPFTSGLISFFLSLGGLIFIKVFLKINLSWLGLILAALLIGLVDLIMPSTLK
jgi:putative membrane protein